MASLVHRISRHCAISAGAATRSTGHVGAAPVFPHCIRDLLSLPPFPSSAARRVLPAPRRRREMQRPTIFSLARLFTECQGQARNVAETTVNAFDLPLHRLERTL